jgi:hypothetical protein
MGNRYALSILHLKERGSLQDSTSRNETGLNFWLGVVMVFAGFNISKSNLIWIFGNELLKKETFKFPVQSMIFKLNAKP